jgi:hypothetical protein
MMGVEAPETCWAKHKHQIIKLWNFCIWLFNLFELYDDARTYQRQIAKYTLQFIRLLSNRKLNFNNNLLNITDSFTRNY